MKNNYLFIFLFWVVLFSQQTYAQTYANKSFYLVDSLDLSKLNKDDRLLLDSCLKEYHSAKHDTIKINALNGICENMINESWHKYQFFQLQFIETKIKTQEPKSTTIYFKKALSSALNNMGFIHMNKGGIPIALEYYHKSLKIDEEMGDKKGMAYSYNNIGVIHDNQGDFPLALDYYYKALKIREEIGDKKGMATSNNNIGGIYKNQGNMPLALKYYQKSLNIREEIGDKNAMATSYHNIGGIHKNMGDIPLALEYFQKSLKISEEIGDKQMIINSLDNIADIELGQGHIKEAKEKGERSLRLAKEIGFVKEIQGAAFLLYKVAQQQGNWQTALEMRNLQVQMSDSLAAEGAVKATANQQAKYEYEKAKALTDAEQAKKDVIAKEEKEKKNIIIYATVAGLVVVLLFLFLLFKRFKVSQNQKDVIQKQKHLVDEKQKEIHDSIHYAKRIQMAMLTSEDYISRNLKAEYFIFYQPKDIVSGDFYWANAQHNKFYIATADCTGHGVPGSFMSLLNISFLNENVIERKIENPAQILNEQRKKIIKALNPTGKENSKDGMDCVLCAFEFPSSTEKNGTVKLSFAAANNPLWLVRNKELTEYKADKMPVGKYEDDSQDFTSQNIDLQKGDIIYTFTDGYADQFGGDRGKKFFGKNLKELLIKNCHIPMAQQKEELSKTINTWKGNAEQVDDILVIGVRI